LFLLTGSQIVAGEGPGRNVHQQLHHLHHPQVCAEHCDQVCEGEIPAAPPDLYHHNHNHYTTHQYHYHQATQVNLLETLFVMIFFLRLVSIEIAVKI